MIQDIVSGPTKDQLANPHGVATPSLRTSAIKYYLKEIQSENTIIYNVQKKSSVIENSKEISENRSNSLKKKSIFFLFVFLYFFNF